MESLPNELMLEIFNYISLITDKRQFLRTCKHYNKIMEEVFLDYESDFEIKYSNEIRIFSIEYNIGCNNDEYDNIITYGVEKFTLELCGDGYFDKIPESYIIPDNKILIKCLSYFNCVELLNVAKLKFCDIRNVCDYGAFGGHINVIKWGCNNGCLWDTKTCSFAALNGHLECLKYLHEGGCPWFDLTCAYAARNGHLSCLSYAHENGCIWGINTCIYASNYDKLLCLKYAHENGCGWSRSICSIAAKHGYLSCLKYAHENGCEWTSETCSDASLNGHLLCLQYARLNGCEWDNNVYKNAIKNGHFELLNWAIENGCPI